MGEVSISYTEYHHAFETTESQSRKTSHGSCALERNSQQKSARQGKSGDFSACFTFLIGSFTCKISCNPKSYAHVCHMCSHTQKPFCARDLQQQVDSLPLHHGPKGRHTSLQKLCRAQGTHQQPEDLILCSLKIGKFKMCSQKRMLRPLGHIQKFIYPLVTVSSYVRKSKTLRIRG